MTDRITSLRSHPHPLESLDWRLSHRNAAAPISPTDLWLSKQGQLYPPTTTTTKKKERAQIGHRQVISPFSVCILLSLFSDVGKSWPPSLPSSPGDWAFNSWVARASGPPLGISCVCVHATRAVGKESLRGGEETKVTKMGEREEKGEKTSRRGQILCPFRSGHPFSLPPSLCLAIAHTVRKGGQRNSSSPFSSSLSFLPWIFKQKIFCILVIEMKEGGEELFCADVQACRKRPNAPPPPLLSCFMSGRHLVFCKRISRRFFFFFVSYPRCAWQGFKMQRRPRVSHTKRSGIQGESAHCAREVP